MSLAAYSDRLSVRPGETIRFQVASDTGTPVETRLARVTCADPNPAGPGVRVAPVEDQVTRVAEPAPATVPQGSYAQVDGLDPWFQGDSFTLACKVLPTHLDGREQAILSRRNAEQGVALMLGVDGSLHALMGGRHTAEGPHTRTALSERRWYLVWMAYDRDARTLQVGEARLHPDAGGDRQVNVVDHSLTTAASPAVNGPLFMAADDYTAPTAHFNGKLEAPVLFDRALSVSEIEGLAKPVNLELKRLQSLDPGLDFTTGSTFQDAAISPRLLIEVGQHIIERAKNRAAQKGLLNVEARIENGDPADCILHCIDEEDIDCVVMGSRGLSGIKGLFLGSVSHKVANRAPCTCITVK